MLYWNLLRGDLLRTVLRGCDRSLTNPAVEFSKIQSNELIGG